MDYISEEERERFLVAGGDEKDCEEEDAEEDCKSLCETDKAMAFFLDGKKHTSKSKYTLSVPGTIIARCKSVELLHDMNMKSEYLHKKLSKSLHVVNSNYKLCEGACNKQYAQLSANKLNSGVSDTDSKLCICSQETNCNSAGEKIAEGEEADVGSVSVKLQHLNGQILPDCTADGEGVLLMQQHRAFAITRDVCHYETSQSSDSVICRICHSAGDEKLIAPCKCAGSSRYVHEPCLVTWFKKSVKNECELCRSEVKIKKINHNLARWRKPEDRPIPLIWFSVFFIGLFLNILSIHVNASEYCKSTACLIFYIVNGFGIILDSAFLYFWFLKCRHYCKKWFALNQDWFIDDLDKLNDNTPVQYVRNEEDKPLTMLTCMNV